VKLALTSLLLCVALLSPLGVRAATVTWPRNDIDLDVQDYGVYACLARNCVLVQSPATLQGYVAQTTVGVNPTFTLDIVNQVGFVAVSARDTALNESGLSNIPNFDWFQRYTPTLQLRRVSWKPLSWEGQYENIRAHVWFARLPEWGRAGRN